MVHLLMSSLVDCVSLYTWREFSECSKSCGGGTKSLSPNITQYAQCGGRACPPKQTEPCNDFDCSGESQTIFLELNFSNMDISHTSYVMGVRYVTFLHIEQIQHYLWLCDLPFLPF